MIAGRFAALSAVALLSACAATPPAPEAANEVRMPWLQPPRIVPPFVPAEGSRESFTATRDFPQGTRLRFTSFSVSAQEELRLQRCGQGCSTAKLVASWHRDDFAKSPAQEVELAEGGDYYLWLRQSLPNGEIGAVQAVAGTFDRDNGVLRFASGTVVFVAIDGAREAAEYPDDPVREGTDVVFDPASEVAKLESSAILERARHGVKQSLYLQLDLGDDIEALSRLTVPAPGEDLWKDPVALARHEAAIARYHAAMREAKQQLLASLRPLGIALLDDSEVTPSMMVAVPSEAALRALQAAPQVHVISEIHRVTLT